MRHLSPGVREKTAACFSALGPQQTSTGWAPGEDSSELSQFRRPDIPNQGVGRAVRPPKAPVEDPSCLFQLLGAPGIPGLVAASLPSLPPRSHCLFPSAVRSPFALLLHGTLVMALRVPG